MLENGAWEVIDGYPNGSPTSRSVPFNRLDVATNLTARKIQDSFASPETMSFWELPGLHQLARQFGLLVATPPPLFQRAARTPLPLCGDGADRGELQPADAAARRRDLDDRRRRRERLRACTSSPTSCSPSDCRRRSRSRLPPGRRPASPACSARAFCCISRMAERDATRHDHAGRSRGWQPLSRRLKALRPSKVAPAAARTRRCSSPPTSCNTTRISD